MNEKTYPVITISRQYGAGGTSVAQKVADQLNLPWFDKDLILRTADLSGYSVEEIKKAGEKVNPVERFVTNLFNPVTYESSTDAIQRAQEEVIRDLAKSPCIIIGRCANIVLQKAGIPCLSVFLHADLEHRMARVAQLSKYEGTDLKTLFSRKDSLRETYYKTYTGHVQGDYRDNSLCIDTGLVGYDVTAEIIVRMAQKMAQ